MCLLKLHVSYRIIKEVKFAWIVSSASYHRNLIININMLKDVIDIILPKRFLVTLLTNYTPITRFFLDLIYSWNALHPRNKHLLSNMKQLKSKDTTYYELIKEHKWTDIKVCRIDTKAKTKPQRKFNLQRSFKQFVAVYWFLKLFVSLTKER